MKANSRVAVIGFFPGLVLAIIICLVLGAAAAHGDDVQPTYAGSASCAGCHEAEYRAWRDSDHAWALREPRPENVLGDFSGLSFTHKNVTSRFFIDGGTYMVETDGPDGKLTRYPVRYIVGHRPLQQYLVETPGGRLQVLDIAWDIEKKSWFHLYPDQDVGAGNGLHWTASYKNWQARCASCHQTGFDKGFDIVSKTYKSHWAELTIGCETCHGPMASHAEAARKGGTTLPRSIKLGPGQQENELAVCGPCHSRREAFSQKDPPTGSAFADHYNLALLQPGNLYFADGQQRDEVFILGSFLQSKMKAKGVTCSNCHEPHGGGLVAEGNAVCTQCHSAAGNPAFSSVVRKDYDTEAHHHHKPGTEAAQCVSCHMPERKYMMIDGRRDHFFRIPDPLQSEAAGAPDVCTACHAGRDQRWAAGVIASWPGTHDRSWQDRRAIIAYAAGGHQQGTASELAQYLRDKERPGIVRASVAEILRDQGTQAAISESEQQELLADPDPLVRAASASMMRNQPAQAKLARLAPLLADPAASVRHAAAIELAGIGAGLTDEKDRAALGRALNEYLASRAANADMPEAHIALGGLALSMRRWPDAEAAFNSALALDPQLEQAWVTLARLRSALGDEPGALKYLSTGMGYLPQSMALLFERGAYESRQGNDAKAIDWYRRIAAIDGQNAQAWMAIAGAALRIRNPELALESAKRAVAGEPENAEAHLVAAIASYMLGDMKAAKGFAVRAKELAPAIVLPSEIAQLLNGG